MGKSSKHPKWHLMRVPYNSFKVLKRIAEKRNLGSPWGLFEQLILDDSGLNREYQRKLNPAARADLIGQQDLFAK